MNVIRRIEASDVPQLFRVRAATDENRLTLDRLAELGINEKSVREKLLSSHQGWLCEEQVETWLFSEGCSSLWLTTDVDTRLRAYSFYKEHGWRDWKIENGLRYMKKCA